MNRLSGILTFSLLIPAGLAAQQAAPANDANPIVSAFRQTASLNYSRNLVTAFDSIPASMYGYKPTPAQLSIGDVAEHLTHANFLICSGIVQKPNPLGSSGEGGHATASKDSLIAGLRASFAYCDSTLAGVTDASLSETIPMPFGNRTASRARLMIVFVTDLADHYSQIANYMRLNHLLPPTALPRRGM